MKKNKKICGASESTPSRSEYFSWINNTNEGSTEQHTLINLDFFQYLKDTYGMQLDIYAWDAGNLDGAGGTYQGIDSAKIKAQYPNGYAPVVKKAAEMGTRMGIWGGADGYGDTEESIEKRREMLVGLCRDYNWALFKFDTVCGALREDKRKEFAKTMRLCRKYTPDLILLNHRNDLGEEEKYATTFLWEGQETYTDVHEYNKITAPHNRAYAFFRGHTPELKRLTEDHGVCLSSSLDFFEDDLIYQAFNRCLILAPEIYGNPWLLRDDEFAKLARIFNLHRRYRDILVKGFALDESYGNNAVVRGNGKTRFIATGNANWNDKTISVRLGKEIGLNKCKKVVVRMHFPHEQFLGCFDYNEQVDIVLPAFRACLIEVCSQEVCQPVLTNCKYETITTVNGTTVRLLSVWGTVGIITRDGEVSSSQFADIMPFDQSMQSPVKLATLSMQQVSDDAEKLYEFACFSADNDSLEYRCLKRSGETSIPQVKRAREMFFNQPSYKLRGLETSIPFDGDDNTVFDTKSRLFEIYHGKGYRCRGGCLRVDFGDVLDIDKVEIEFFDGMCNPPHVFAPQVVNDNLETSRDLLQWTKAPLTVDEKMCNYSLDYFDYYVDSPMVNHGVRRKAVYKVEEPARYFRLPEQMDRIFTIKAFKEGKEVRLNNPHLTNLFAPYYNGKTSSMSSATVVLPDKLPQFPYIAVAVEGVVGNEGVTCVARVDGKLVAFPQRAPAYPVNAYECYVYPTDGYYTFYLPMDQSWAGKRVEVICSFVGNAVPTDVYLCDGNGNREDKVVKLTDAQ